MVMRRLQFFTMLLIQTATTAASSSSGIRELVLVNSETGKEIMVLSDNVVIDTTVTGLYLTIQAKTATPEVDCVVFDLDRGRVQRTEHKRPFVLAGKKEQGGGPFQLYDSVALREAGFHSITVRSCSSSSGAKPLDPTAIETLENQPPQTSNNNNDNMYAYEPIPLTETFAEKTMGTAHRSRTSGGAGGHTLRRRHQKDRHLADADDDVWTISFQVTVTTTTTYGSVAQSKIDRTSSRINDVSPYNFSVDGARTGELQRWHKITLGWVVANPTVSEADSSRRNFADHRLDVVFAHQTTGHRYTVPGYYAGNGNAANNDIDSATTGGNVWLCHFRPDEIGEWTWTAEYTEGDNVAANREGTPANYFHGVQGSFVVADTDKTGADLRSKGRWRTVGKSHLQFAGSGEYFLKAGPGSPGNLLAHQDFHGTLAPEEGGKAHAPHVADYHNESLPTFANGKGADIFGAINYLARLGMNVMSLATLNINDGVFPFISAQESDVLTYDVSKLAQWDVVLDHAEKMGIALHIKLQDGNNTDCDRLLGASLSNERKLYYREMIARLGHHLAITWNIGSGITDTDQILSRSAFIKSLDPYQSPIIVHATTSNQHAVYVPLLGALTIDGASLQADPSNAARNTYIWYRNSHDAGRPWIISVDETDDPVATGDDDVMRRQVLWGNILNGGAGIQYFLGLSSTAASSDFTVDIFRSRDSMWAQTKLALDFFKNNDVPFWDMNSVNGNKKYLVDSKQNTIVFYKSDNHTTLNLPGENMKIFSVGWFDPRNGGALQHGTESKINGGPQQPLGAPLYNEDMDWVALLRCTVNCNN